MALDWPLSREEKKSRLLHLYDADNRILTDAQRFDELRIRVLREELRAAHRTGDPLACPPRRRSLIDQPRKYEPLRSIDLTTHTACVDVASTEQASNTLENLRLVFGFAKDAVDDGFAAIGSLLRNTMVDDGSDSDRSDIVQVKPRARSEGAQSRDHAAPALKKPNSRRLSRGGQPLRVAFEDDATTKSKMCDASDYSLDEQPEPMQEPMAEPMAEPMTEPEPSNSSGSLSSPGVHGGRQSFSMCSNPDHRPCSDDNVREQRGRQERSITPRRDSRRDAALGSASRRARLRDRLHGYSINDAP